MFSDCFCLVLVAGLEPARSCLRGILSPLRLPFRHTSFWRYHPDLNRGIKVLQTFALPLGDGTILERKTGLEPATFALARQRSTTEPLPQTCMPSICCAPQGLLL